MKKTIGIIAVVLALACVQRAGAKTWYVKTDGDDSASGESWESALLNPQTAVDQAAPGDSVWVAAGEYESTNVRGIDGVSPWASSFVLKDGVSLYGGFAGDENSLEARVVSGQGAWAFAHATILTSAPTMPGQVLYGGQTAFVTTTIVDGFTLTGGAALGIGLDGRGGGASLPPGVCMRNCIVTENLARDGGGVALHGASALESCLVCSNELETVGWGGEGGGIRAYGDGGSISNCLIHGNAQEGGARSGGGIYADGESTITFCTIVLNTSPRRGSGVSLAGSARLANSIIWGNTGCGAQVYAPEAAMEACALEGAVTVGSCIPLESANAGESGPSGNDSWVDGYYVCFAAPEEGDFSLAAGSYAINRATASYEETSDAAGTARACCGIADMGAFESPWLGNLAIDYEIEYPFIYGCSSGAAPLLGLASPLGVELLFSGTSTSMEWTQETEASALWLAAGPANVTLNATPDGEDAAYWKPRSLTREIDVLPRPLVLSADEQEFTYGDDFPALTWQIVAGSLVDGDSIIGAPACAYEDVLDTAYPITIGTLAVDDSADGANYSFTFQEGTLIYHKAEALITIADTGIPYSGFPVSPSVETGPAGLDVVIIYTGTGDTTYGPSTTPPTDAGTYAVTVTVDDPHYTGTLEAVITIEKANLTVTADSTSRMYHMANPTFTATITGFLGDDSVLDISVPTLHTTADYASPVGTYPIIVSGGAARNYNIIPKDGVLSVTKASLTVLVEASDIIYGERVDASELKGSAVHSGNGESVAGTFQWDDGDDVLVPGSYERSWSFVPEDTHNYSVATGTVTLVIAQRGLQIKADDIMQTYGEAELPLTYTVLSGELVDGDVFTGSLARDAGTDVGSYTISKGTLTAGPNYAIEFTPGTYTIVKSALTIAADSTSRMYHMANPTFTATITGFLGDDSVSDISAPTLHTTADYASPVGTYPIVVNGGSAQNYNIIPVDGVLSVTKASLTVSVEASDIIYGERVDASELNGSAVHSGNGESVAGTFQWDDGDDVLAPGSYERSWSFVPEDTLNYSVATGTVTLVIAQRGLQLKADDIMQTYGEAELPLTYTVLSGELVDGDVFTGSLARDAGTDVGSYTISRGTLTAGPNYAIDFTPGTYTIAKSALTIAADSTSRMYRMANPTFTATITGFLGDDSVSDISAPTLHTTADYASPVGTYPIVVNGGSAQNYNITPKDGVLSVTKASLTVSVEASDIIYGERVDASVLNGSAVHSGNGESVAGTFQWDDGDDVLAPGSYERSWKFVPEDTLNYSVATGTVTLVIAQRGLQLKADDIIQTYGEAELPLTYTVLSGELVDGDVFTGSLARDAGTDVGSYTITKGTLTAGPNYAIEFTPGTYTIAKRALTIALAPASKQYGQDEPALTYSITDGSLADGSTFTGTPEREAGEKTGTYAITQGTIAISDPDNYSLTCINAVFTITRATLAISGATPVATDIVYGDAVADSTLSGTIVVQWSGVPVAGSFIWDDPDVHPNAGNIEAQWTFMPDDAESFVPLTGFAVINVAKATLTASLLDENPCRYYNTDNPVFTIVYTGFVNGDTVDCLDTTPTVSCAATTASLPGDYPITVSGGEDDNYSFNYIDGTLTVVIKTANATVSAASVKYGTPLSEIALSGTFIDPDTSENILGTLAWKDAPDTVPTPSSNARVAVFTPASSGYEIISTIVEIDILKRSLVIVPASVQKEYDGEEPKLTWSLSVDSDSILDGDALDIELERVSGTDVGTYAIVLKYWSGHEGYTLALAEAYLTIVPLTINVTASSASKYYGESDPEFSYTCTPSVSDVLTGTLSRSVGDVPGTYAITQGGLKTSSGNYTIAFTEGSFTILPAVLRVMPKNLSKQYGDVDPPITYTYSVIYGGGIPKFSGTLSREPGEAPGKYAVLIGTLSAGDNYTINLDPVKFTIGLRNVCVQIDDIKMLDTEELPEFTYTIVSGSLLPGDTFTGAPALTGPLEQGQNTIGIGTLAINDNYSLTAKPGKLSVYNDNLKLTITHVDDISYGQPLSASKITGYAIRPLHEDPVPGTFTWEEPDTMLSVGLFYLDIIFTPDPASGCNFIGETAHLIRVNPMVFKLSVDDKTIYYGDEVPELTYTITEGFIVGNDILFGQPVLKDYQMIPGEYEISEERFVMANSYNTEFTGGTLTVLPRPITIKADDITKAQGEEEPELTWSIVEGSLVNNDTVGGSLYREAGETPGRYVIQTDNLTISEYYDATFIPGTFTITAQGTENTRSLTEEADVTAEGTGEETDTLTDAIASAPEGTEIILQPVIYIAPNGLWELPGRITIRGVPDADGNQPLLVGCLRLTSAASGSSIENLTIESDDGPAVVIANADGISLVDCTLSGSYMALNATAPACLTATGCFMKAGIAGIMFHSGAPDGRDAIRTDNSFDAPYDMVW